MKFDFSGWATRNNLKCSDGRTIMRDAFKHSDGQTVPLVWNHQHNDPLNVLGHARLENRSVLNNCSFSAPTLFDIYIIFNKSDFPIRLLIFEHDYYPFQFSLGSHKLTLFHRRIYPRVFL